MNDIKFRVKDGHITTMNDDAGADVVCQQLQQLT